MNSTTWFPTRQSAKLHHRVKHCLIPYIEPTFVSSVELVSIKRHGLLLKSVDGHKLLTVVHPLPHSGPDRMLKEFCSGLL